jgi:XTP/dITP diphosphohydrolase
MLLHDSGLEVDILNGQPGIHSARYASDKQNYNASDSDNNAKLLTELAGVPDPERRAQFCCALAIVTVGQIETKTFKGTCRGRISKSGTGKHGFGYDSLFIPDGYSQSFAELGPKTKNVISHRAKALLKLANFLNNPYEGR